MTSSLLPPLVLEILAKAGAAHAEIQAVGADVDKMAAKTEAGTRRGQAAFSKMAGAGKALSFGLVGAGVAVGAASLKLGTDFQESTTQLVTGAGETEDNLAKIRSGLLQMAPAVGMGPDALAKAMFLVESAGFHGAQGLQVMKAAAEGAKIGGADATVVANGLTTALDDYHIPAAQAADVTSKLVATVAAGKTSMADLAGSLSAVLPAASAAHVGLDDVLGAIGTMTGEGISAQQAAQDLAGTIRSLQNPSQVQAAAMDKLGFSATDVATNLGKMGLDGTLNELSDTILSKMGPSGTVLLSSLKNSQQESSKATEMLKSMPPALQKVAEGYLKGTISTKTWRAETKTMTVEQKQLASEFAATVNRSRGFSDELAKGGPAAKTFSGMLSDVTGGATGMNVALALTGKNTDTYANNIKNISHASAEAGGHVKGWAETQKDFSTQMAQAKAGVEAMGVKIGLALIPVIQDAIKTGVRWSDWLTQHKPVLYAVAGVIGGLVVTAITAYVASLVIAAATTVASMVTMAASAVAWGASMLAAGAMALLPFAPIILAVGAVAFAGYELYKHWSTIWGDIKKIAVDAEHWAEDIFHNKITQTIIGLVAPGLFLALHWRQVWGDIKGSALDAWHFLDSYVLHPIETGFNGLVHFLNAIQTTVGNVFAGMFNGLEDSAKTGFDWVARAWNETVGSLSFHIPSWVPGVGGNGFSMPTIPTFAKGGQLDLSGWNLVGEMGPELVGPRGKVFSNRDSSKMLASGLTPRSGGGAAAGGGGGGNQPIVVHTTIELDGVKLGDALQTVDLQRGQRRGGAYKQNQKVS